MKMRRLILSVVTGLLLISFGEESYARKFQPGEFRSIGHNGDDTGNLKRNNIRLNGDRRELRFTDSETGEIVYSIEYDESVWYILDYFSPDGRTLYLLWQKQSSHTSPGYVSKRISLIDIYNKKEVWNVDVMYGDNWWVSFSPCSSIAYVAIGYTSQQTVFSGVTIRGWFIDLRTYKVLYEYNRHFSPDGFVIPVTVPPINVFVTSDGRQVNLSDGPLNLSFNLPSESETYSDDPDPPWPPLSIFPGRMLND